MKDQIAFLGFLVTFGTVLVGITSWALISLHKLDKKVDSEFKDHRHDYKGRFRHVYQRILRLELWASQTNRKPFNPNSDLPDLGPDERKQK